MYKVIVRVSAALLLGVGIVLAGWAPIVLSSASSASIPPTNLTNPSVMLTWTGLSAARVLGAVLVGVGVAFLGAARLESSEARRFALRALGLIGGTSLLMTCLQAWAIIPRAPAWGLALVFALVVFGSVLGSAAKSPANTPA